MNNIPKFPPQEPNQDAQKERQEKSPVKKGRILRGLVKKALYGSAAAAGIAAGVGSYIQEDVNKENERLNHVFSVEDLTLEEKIKLLIGTTPYTNDISQNLSKKFPTIASYLRTKTDAGLVHLYKGEMPSVTEAKKAVKEIRAGSERPVLISADIEGGNVNHITLTKDELRRFGLPEEILTLRAEELKFYADKAGREVNVEEELERRPLPSQEWLGRTYEKLLLKLKKAQEGKNPIAIAKTEEEVERFKALVESYGETIASICEHIGINIVFGPNLDMVKDVDGNLPDEKQDRSFGSNYKVVSDLTVSYLQGIGKSGKVFPVVKHFGNSFAQSDSHTTTTESLTDKNDGSLIPYRNAINASSPEERKLYLQQQRQKLLEQFQALVAEENLILKKSQKLQKPNKPLRNNHGHKKRSPEIKKITLQKAKLSERVRDLDARITKLDSTPGFPLGVMTSVSNSNLYKWRKGSDSIPVAYNLSQIQKITKPKEKGGLGHSNLVVSDDLVMRSSGEYIETLQGAIASLQKEPVSKEALAIHQALSAGNSLALVTAVAGSEDRHAKEVARLVREGVSFEEQRSKFSPNHQVLRKRGEADLTPKRIDEFAKKVLDAQASVGLINKVDINGKEYYMLDPRMYNPSVWDVVKNSLASNQFPWTDKGEKPVVSQPSQPELLFKAYKNLGLSILRLGMLYYNDGIPELDKERFGEPQKEPKKLVIVDKSIQKMFLYDYETRELVKEYAIGIGKGGLKPRRFVGDHSTPTGKYRLVQKRDDIWWKREKGQPLPDFYGGKDGGMLVLAGQWHPEIAIHGNVSSELGEVSNGCVRTTNTDIQELMKTVPMGSMIVVTR